MEEASLVMVRRSPVMPMVTAITCSGGEDTRDSAATQWQRPSNMATHHRCWHTTDLLKRHDVISIDESKARALNCSFPTAYGASSDDVCFFA